jgi:hypothetical protein
MVKFFTRAGDFFGEFSENFSLLERMLPNVHNHIPRV